MKSAVALSVALLATGCAVAVDDELAARCDDLGAIDRQVGLDIELGGIDQEQLYYFDVVADGAHVLLPRAPDAPNLFVEARVPGRGNLVVVLFENVLRTIIQEPDGRTIGPSEITVRVYAGGTELIAKTFAPAYEHAEPQGPECDDFHAVEDMLVVPPPP